MTETEIGGSHEEAPPTAWSRLLAARNDAAGRERAMEHLARHYWKPVYCYIRRAWKKPVEEAKDLTQAFFAWMLETDVLSRLDPSRGRFRSFLKVVLRNFLNHEYEAAQAVKRGGRVATLPLEIDPREEAEFMASGDSPDAALDAAWRAGVLEQAVARLRQDYEARGKSQTFDIFRDHDLAPGERPDYEALAKLHGVTKTAVSDALQSARTALRRQVVSVVTDSVTSPEDARDELRELFGFGESPR